MVSIDARTRRRSDVRALSADEVVAERLPELVGAHGKIAAAGVRVLGTGALDVTVADQRFSLTTEKEVSFGQLKRAWAWVWVGMRVRLG